MDGDKIVVSVKEQIQLQPTLDVDLKFNQMLKEILIANNIDESILDEIIDFTISSAYKETDKETYQAMEAFIHNLNTMHSRAGGASTI